MFTSINSFFANNQIILLVILLVSYVANIAWVNTKKNIKNVNIQIIGKKNFFFYNVGCFIALTVMGIFFPVVTGWYLVITFITTVPTVIFTNYLNKKLA